MDYQPMKMKNTISIRRLYSFHYFQFACGYLFPGEQHNFWEMVYIDRGEAEIGAGSRTLRLTQGQIIFHEPNEFHSIWADSVAGADLLVVSFACSSEAMKHFRKAVFTLDSAQRRHLMLMVSEGRQLFGPVLDILTQKSPLPLSDAPEGSSQMIALYLMQFLILLLRSGSRADSPPVSDPIHLTTEHHSADLIAQLTAYMRGHPDGSLRFADICRISGMGQTTLKEYFRRHTGQSVMACYRRIRIEEARRLLREGRLNVSQVAEALGYSSVQYFSTQFKREMGVSPLEYLRTVRH